MHGAGLRYVTTTPEHSLEVSRRIRDEFEPGRDYYGLHGRSINPLDNPAHRPERAALIWHNENRFLGKGGRPCSDGFAGAGYREQVEAKVTRKPQHERQRRAAPRGRREYTEPYWGQGGNNRWRYLLRKVRSGWTSDAPLQRRLGSYVPLGAAHRRTGFIGR